MIALADNFNALSRLVNNTIFPRECSYLGPHMLVLILGLVLFLGVHSTRIFVPEMREHYITARGANSWKMLYTVVSLVGLVLIVWGFVMARQAPVVLYTPVAGINHLALLLMLPVFPLFAASHSPGYIKATVKHPMLVATILWGVAHLLVNGTLADVLLFGGFAVWAFIDVIASVKRGPVVLSRGPILRKDISAIVAGLAIYALFVFWLHQFLFGVSPL